MGASSRSFLSQAQELAPLGRSYAMMDFPDQPRRTLFQGFPLTRFARPSARA